MPPVLPFYCVTRYISLLIMFAAEQREERTGRSIFPLDKAMSGAAKPAKIKPRKGGREAGNAAYPGAEVHSNSGSAFAAWGETRSFLDEREIFLPGISSHRMFNIPLVAIEKDKSFRLGYFWVLFHFWRMRRRMNNSVPDSVFKDDEPVISSAPS